MQKLSQQDFYQFPFVRLAHLRLINDRDYNLPTSRWLSQKFYPFFNSELNRYNIFKWRETWDCDDFATMFRILAQVCHNNSGAKNKAQGIAVAEIGYTREFDNQLHAINCVFTEKGPLFIEPQTCQVIIFSKKEYDSIYRIRL